MCLNKRLSKQYIDAGEWRRYRSHYGVTVMFINVFVVSEEILRYQDILISAAFLSPSLLKTKVLIFHIFQYIRILVLHLIMPINMIATVQFLYAGLNCKQKLWYITIPSLKSSEYAYHIGENINQDDFCIILLMKTTLGVVSQCSAISFTIQCGPF